MSTRHALKVRVGARLAAGFALLVALTTVLGLHGGRLSVESAGLGRGASFTLRLPLHAAMPDRPSPPAEVASARQSISPEASLR